MGTYRREGARVEHAKMDSYQQLVMLEFCIDSYIAGIFGLEKGGTVGCL